jgi:GTP-sensing pleiotropic transcriptional regulator CodY
MGEMRRANAREEEQRKRDRFASTLVIAASIIAAVRLARDDISRPSPRLTSVIADSVGLARMILDRVVR